MVCGETLLLLLCFAGGVYAATSVVAVAVAVAEAGLRSLHWLYYTPLLAFLLLLSAAQVKQTPPTLTTEIFGHKSPIDETKYTALESVYPGLSE